MKMFTQIKLLFDEYKNLCSRKLKPEQATILKDLNKRRTFS
jgi:hypothetical protein